MSTAIRASVFSFVGALNAFHTFHRQSLPSWSCGFNLQLVNLVGGFWIFFLSHTAPGFQLWFYFHLCKWVVHWGLLLRLPWRTWVCHCEGQVWRWCSCLGRRGSGSTRYSGGLAARVAGNIVWQSVLANTLQYPCLGFPGGSDAKASASNVGDLGSIPGLGRSPGEGNGNPLQHFCLENPMDGGAW